AFGEGGAFMTRRGLANKLRLVLGVALAIGVGLASHMAEGNTLLTYGLPAIILILTLADFTGYLASRDDRSKRPGADSASEPGAAPGAAPDRRGHDGVS